MYKRIVNNRESECIVPAKRPKYDPKKENRFGVPGNSRETANDRNRKTDDIWGDDYAEEDIQEMDFVASQVCPQQEIAGTQRDSEECASFIQRFNSTPSTSKISSKLNINERSAFTSMRSMSHYGPGRKPDDLKNMSHIVSVDYKEFEEKLVDKKLYNSTFKLDNNIIVPESGYSKELERLKLENRKLLNDFMTKEGEAVFLRNQLQQTQLRAENDKLEKTRLIEEQESRHRSEINAICKEKEYLKTQLDLQTFEVGNLMERCKLLESGNIKLTEPHTSNYNVSVQRNKFNSSMNRSSASNVKHATLTETSVQTSIHNKWSYQLKIRNLHYPLIKIPKFIYDASQPEKSIVDIQVIEKTGRRNLPILQEEDTFRIIENPELVKPVTTMIDDKKVTVEFILPEIAVLQQKTVSEIGSENTIPIINKLVSTARELLLNLMIVLQTIFHVMRNDDIRDINDIYFSELYSNRNFNGKSVFDASGWHDCERGIETRRVFGVLSYVTVESTYLSGYIAGKSRLFTEKDDSYKHYSGQMIRYNMWPEKDHEFEMLQMILQFVTLVGSTRRSHQFSGLMCAIMLIIYNVHKKVEYCCKGMDYVYQIFKEIVFSRPLPYCYVFLSNMIVIFMKSTTYLRKLCVSSQSMTVNNWKGALHFTPDACPLQIFLAQVENHNHDLIVAIDITDTLLEVVQSILQTDVIPLRSETLDSCNCCMKLLRFTIRTLSKCTEVNLSSLGDFNPKNLPLQRDVFCNLKSICSKHSDFRVGTNRKCIREIYTDKFLDENSWATMKRKQWKVLTEGIRFLSHLAICDPDFVIRLSDIEDSFHLFMRNINTFDNFVLHENEKEAMNRIKQTFIFDKTLQPEAGPHEMNSNPRQLNLSSNFEKRTAQTASSKSKKNENYSKIRATIKALYAK